MRKGAWGVRAGCWLLAACSLLLAALMLAALMLLIVMLPLLATGMWGCSVCGSAVVQHGRVHGFGGRAHGIGVRS